MLDTDGRERDRLGRAVPRRVSWLMLHRATGVLSRFKEVPANYWQRGTGEACIACPCGATPIVTEGESVTCTCDRIYLLARVVYVANSPRPSPEVNVD